jgi:hypothetical protein
MENIPTESIQDKIKILEEFKEIYEKCLLETIEIIKDVKNTKKELINNILFVNNELLKLKKGD